MLHYGHIHTSVGKARDIRGGGFILRYDAMSLGDQFLDVLKGHKAFIFTGVKFLTFRPWKVKSLLSFKMLRNNYLVT